MDRNDNLASLVLGQSPCPTFLQTISYTTSAAISGIWPVTVDKGPGNSVLPLSGLYGGVGAASPSGSVLLILQPTTDCYVRLVGSGTVAASGTVTYAAASGAQTITINARQVGFTATGVAATDAALAVAAINGDPVLKCLVVASSSAGVCTITARNLGVGGNAYTLAATGTGATASGANLASGSGPSAGTTASNAILIPANQQMFVYTFAWHTHLDVKASASSGTMNVFVGL